MLLLLQIGAHSGVAGEPGPALSEQNRSRPSQGAAGPSFTLLGSSTCPETSPPPSHRSSGVTPGLVRNHASGSRLSHYRRVFGLYHTFCLLPLSPEGHWSLSLKSQNNRRQSPRQVVVLIFEPFEEKGRRALLHLLPKPDFPRKRLAVGQRLAQPFPWPAAHCSDADLGK